MTLRLRSEPGDQAVVEVADTGPGLVAGAAERVFERFYRADAARTRRTDGGDRHRARAGHRGGAGARRTTARVEVDSEPGEGATFRVTAARRSARTIRTTSRDETVIHRKHPGGITGWSQSGRAR